jgi:hypothetical protein
MAFSQHFQQQPLLVLVERLGLARQGRLQRPLDQGSEACLAPEQRGQRGQRLQLDLGPQGQQQGQLDLV